MSEAPATAKLLLTLIPSYFEPEALAAVSGGREETTDLLQLPFDFIFFTGSTRVGKIVMRAAAEHLTPVVLELGGQNPAIVDETANLNDAARKLVWGATAWGGQWCTSPGYVYVHESVADEFVAECKKAVIELYGDRPKENSDYSRIINAREVKRLASLIDPGKVVIGGNYDEKERYFDPTILYPVDWSDKIMEEEIFGPILPVLRYYNFNDAIATIKSRPRPLVGFIFSQNQSAIDQFISSLSFGGGAVNQSNVNVYIEKMPFRRRWRIRHGLRQRKARIRFADARNSNLSVASGRLDRSPVSSLYDGQNSGAWPVARVLARWREWAPADSCVFPKRTRVGAHGHR